MNYEVFKMIISHKNAYKNIGETSIMITDNGSKTIKCRPKSDT